MRKILTCMLILVLSVSIITGCNNTTPSADPGNTDSTATPDNTATPDSTATATPGEPTPTPGGDSKEWLSSDWAVMPSNKNPNLKYFGYFNSDGLGSEQGSYIDEIAALGNANIVMLNSPLNNEKVISDLTDARNAGFKAIITMPDFFENGVLGKLNSAKLKSDYQTIWDEFQTAVQSFIDDGTIYAFYIDEPRWNGISRDDFRTVTKYIRECAPTVGIMACMTTIDIGVLKIAMGECEEDYLEYCTDVMFDLYGDWIDADRHNMLAKLESKATNDQWIWGCIKGFENDPESNGYQTMIDNVRGQYTEAIQDDRYAGILAFSYANGISDGDWGYGLSDFFDITNDYYSKELKNEYLRVGRAIIGAEWISSDWNIMPENTNPNLKYFGYFHSDGFGSQQSSYIDEIAALGNANIVMINSAWSNEDAVHDLTEARNAGMKAIITVRNLVQGGVMGEKNSASLNPNYETVWNEFQAAVQKFIDDGTIYAFYFDEPRWLGIGRANFRLITRYIRESCPTVGVMACMTYMDIGVIPSDIGECEKDYLEYCTDVMFDYYGDWDDTERREMLAKLKSKATNGQWIWGCPKGFETDPGTNGYQTMIDHIKGQYTEAIQDDRYAGIIAFSYANGRTEGDWGYGLVDFFNKQSEYYNLSFKNLYLKIGRAVIGEKWQSSDWEVMPENDNPNLKYFGYFGFEECTDEIVALGNSNIALLSSWSVDELVQKLINARSLGFKAIISTAYYPFSGGVMSQLNSATLRSDYKELWDNFQAIIQEFIDDGTIYAFYFDEPRWWGASCEDFRKVTKYIRESAPTIGVMACMTYIDMGIVPAGMGECEDDYLEYCTDVMFDYYGAWNDEDRHKMLETLKSKATNGQWIWGCVKGFEPNPEENGDQVVFDHIKGQYTEAIMDDRYVGILVFSYTNGNVAETWGNGLGDFFNEEFEYYSERLKDIHIKIGRAIIGDYDWKTN